MTIADKICALFDESVTLRCACKSYDEVANARLAEINTELARFRETAPTSYRVAVRRYS